MPLEMKYFVLDPKGIDPYACAARLAMYTYSEHIREHDPKMAIALRRWVLKESSEAFDKIKKGE